MENMEKVVYLDNAATTACAPEVLAVMVEALSRSIPVGTQLYHGQVQLLGLYHRYDSQLNTAEQGFEAYYDAGFL